MLSDRDESDIICILFPTSPPAYEAVKLTAKAAPQHILQNHAISQIDEESEDIPLEDNKTRSDRSPDSDIENTQRHDARKGEDGSDGIESARDIALRFSSQVHNICLGFTFGRNPRTCDVLLSGDNNKQVSNKHFRIYFNSNGSLMLEDTSTNGTIVDGTLLQGSKAKMMKGDPQPRHTILGGGMIDLPTITRENGDSVRFGVRMPSRDNHLEKYRQNLVAYLNLVEQAERQATATANAASNGLPIAPPPVSHCESSTYSVRFPDTTVDSHERLAAWLEARDDSQRFYLGGGHRAKQPSWPALEWRRQVQCSQLHR